MTTMTELIYLRNAANPLGLEIHQELILDGRYKIGRYFAKIGEKTVSPKLDYEQMNNFLMGWFQALKNIRN